MQKTCLQKAAGLSPGMFRYLGVFPVPVPGRGEETCFIILRAHLLDVSRSSRECCSPAASAWGVPTSLTLCSLLQLSPLPIQCYSVGLHAEPGIPPAFSTLHDFVLYLPSSFPHSPGTEAVCLQKIPSWCPHRCICFMRHVGFSKRLH